MNSNPRNFSSSATVRLNAVFGTIGTILIALPDVLAQILLVLGTPEVQRAILLLPPRAREVVEIVTRTAGILLAVFAALNMRQRVKSDGPVAPPKIGKGV